MRYTKVVEFADLAAVRAAVRPTHGAALPPIDRAEVHRGNRGEYVFRVLSRRVESYYRVDSDGAGGWVFYGGTLLVDPRAFEADPGATDTPKTR